MEVHSVINESALKGRKYLIKPRIRESVPIASHDVCLLAARIVCWQGRPSTMLLAVFAICHFYGELKMIGNQTD